jgi:hypothetical protein
MYQALVLAVNQPAEAALDYSSPKWLTLESTLESVNPAKILALVLAFKILRVIKASLS